MAGASSTSARISRPSPIAEAAAKSGARVVALSIIHPADDPALPGELRALRERLTADTPIIMGGRAAAQYREVLLETLALHLSDPREFRARLGALLADGTGTAQVHG